MARYALVVGIADYPKAGQLSSLRRTATDAEAVAQRLQDFGNFDNINNIKRLTGRVTTEELSQEIKSLFDRAKKQAALIYFTGHGVKLTSNLGVDSGILAASDTIVRKEGDRAVLEGENAIKLNDLNQLVSQASLSSLVVLLDCCHSELLIPEFSPDLVDRLTAFNRNDVDVFFMAACRKAEEAIAKAGAPHSVFTGALLDAFAQSQADASGAVTCGRVFDHVFGALAHSGQEPRQLGRGRSIRLLTYPVEHPTAQEPVNFQNPYVGLEAFNEVRQKYFYGRETAVKELLNCLENSRVLTVFGPSGSGKSSLVKAGLIPALGGGNGLPGSARWEIAKMTPGSSPLQILRERVSSYHQQSNPYVLFIDQFEELFTLCQNETERIQFIQQIGAEVDQSPNLMKVIIAIRGDFLDRCAQIPDSAKLINRDNEQNAYMVTDLNNLEMAAAIERPAQQNRVSLEYGLLPEIIGDVRDQPGGLPLLQYALQKLWEVCIRPDTEPTLTLAGYRQVGRVQGALEQRADQIYRDFHDEDRAFFLKTLIPKLVYVPDDPEQMAARQRVSWQRLRETATPDQIKRVVAQLIRERLLVANEHTVEVAHDTLLTHWHLIRDWIANNRESLHLSRLLETDYNEWLKRKKSPDYLLSEGRLSQIQEWNDREKPSLSQDERKFLEKSVEKRDHEKNRERQRRQMAEILAIAVASLATVTCGITGVALMLQSQLTNNAVNYAFGFLDQEEIKRLLPQGEKTAEIVLEQAKNLEKSREFDKAIDRYRTIRDKLQNLNLIVKDLDFNGKEKLKKLAADAESYLIGIIEAEKISKLKTDYFDKYPKDKNVLGKRIGDVSQLDLVDLDKALSSIFDPGAVQETYKILMIDTGADMNKNGVLDNYTESDRVPCETLDSIEEKWKAINSSCCWLEGDIDPDCSPIKGTLMYSVFGSESAIFIRDRLKNCPENLK